MVLDNLNQLRSISDKKNMDDILSFANTNVATDLEKCLLVRETVINIEIQIYHFLIIGIMDHVIGLILNLS